MTWNLPSNVTQGGKLRRCKYQASLARKTAWTSVGSDFLTHKDPDTPAPPCRIRLAAAGRVRRGYDCLPVGRNLWRKTQLFYYQQKCKYQITEE
jgi:hypothetical protein